MDACQALQAGQPEPRMTDFATKMHMSLILQPYEGSTMSNVDFRCCHRVLASSARDSTGHSPEQ